MLPSLTPAVARALDAARQHARGQDSPEVLPVHLLYALLDEEHGAATSLAQQAGLDPDAYLAARPQPPAFAPDQRPLAAAAETLLYRARELAVELTGESDISSEPVLLALVRHEPPLADWLAGLGMSPDRLETLLEGRRPPALPIEEPLYLADLTEQMDVARILDASFNRSREALRVVEDYSRFALDDAFLSGQFKSLRHELTTALWEMAPPELILARETQADVGTSISTDSERHRDSLRDVVAANLERLKEALRSLEEFSKVTRPQLAERIEQLRYRAYTLERAVLLGGQARQQLREARLYALLSGSSCEASLEWTIEEAAAGGVNVVQLREKAMADRELVARAREVRRWTRKAGVLFIVNDRPDVARLVEADGVHLGQDDVTVKDARRILGPHALIGVSTHDLDQLRQAVLAGASYVGVGPVFPSTTKTFGSLAGLEFVAAAMRETSLPAFAIGGINEATIGAAVAAGARRVAVSAAIGRADDPRQAAARLRAVLDEAGR